MKALFSSSLRRDCGRLSSRTPSPTRPGTPPVLSANAAPARAGIWGLAAAMLAGSVLQAHNLDTRSTSIFFAKDFLQTMSARAALNQPLVQAGDEFWVVLKTTPVAGGVTTGVGGYQTFYVPSGVRIADAAYVQYSSSDPRGFIPISMKGQSPIAIGDGPIGAKVQTGLTGYSYPSANILGVNSAPVTVTGLARGTIAGVYADTGIFYSTNPNTAFNSYGAPVNPTMINNSGDTVGEYNALNAIGKLGVMTAWDSWQLRAFGRKDTIAIIDAADQRGNGPWGLASAVAGPESGYKWAFNHQTFTNTPGTISDKVQAAIEVGPWNRIKYPGSQISKDQPGLISTTLGYVGVDGSSVGYDFSMSGPLPNTVNAVRFAIGQLESQRPEYSAVKVHIDAPPSPTCYKMFADAFGGDAGGTDNGKDHIWRYFDPTVVNLEPCALLQKVAAAPIVAPGGTTAFTITFANMGTVALPNVVLTDTLPSGLLYLSATPAPSTISGSVLTWSVGTVQPGQVISITVNVKATGTGALVNGVCATSNGSTLECAEETIQVGYIPLLRKVKSVSSGTVAPGATVTYSITVYNEGTGPNPVPLTITDYLPTGFTYSGFVSATLNGAAITPTINAANTSQPIFTVSSAGIAAGKTLVIQFNALVAANTPTGTYCNNVELGFNGMKIPPTPEACVTVAGAEIGDTVYRDWNNNGIQDSGEEGLPGVTVTLTYYGADGVPGGGDDVVTNKVTDSNGNYLFTGLVAGNYSVDVPTPGSGGVPTGYTLTTANDPTAVTLALNESRLDVDFGFKPGGTGQIGDQVFEDKNGDGIFNGTDVGITGVTVNLYEDTNGNGLIDAGDNLIDTRTTGAGGIYPNFTGLATGLSYIVDADEAGAITTYFSPNSFTGTTPALRSVPNLAGTVLTADFGYRANLPSSIGDTVFKDVNLNGVYDLGVDMPIANVTVNLYRDSNNDGIADGPAVATTSSDIAGQYLFSGLAPDIYLVVVNTADPDVPTGYVATTTQYKITLPVSTTVLIADFPFIPVIRKAGPATANPGDTISYTLDVDYNGNNQLLQNVSVCDTLPSGVSFVSADNRGRPASVDTYTDHFNIAAFNNSDGSADWSALSWAETGDNANAGTGNIFMDTANSRLSFNTQNNTTMEIRRTADLTGAGYATLDVIVATSGLDVATAKVELEASNDGISWTSLDTFSNTHPTTTPVTYTYNLVDKLGSVGANTRIRFRNNSTTANKIITFEEVEIAFAASASPMCWDFGSVQLASPSTRVQAGTTTIIGDADAEVTDDNFVDQANPATVQSATGNDIKVKTETNKSRYGLVRWDLSSLAGATVVTADIELFQNNKKPTATLNIHQNTSSWTEGTVNWNNQPTINAFPVATVSTKNNATGYITSPSTAALVSMVQAWINNAAVNFGVKLISSKKDELKFDSTEKAAGGNNPILRIVTGGSGNWKNTLTATPTIANVGDTITILMKLDNNTASAVTGVTPPANLTVNNVAGAGASATKITGPSPTGPVTIAANSSATFAYTYTVTGPLTAPDQIYFSGVPTSSSPVNTWNSADSNGTLIAPTMTLSVKVNNPSVANFLNNTAKFTSTTTGDIPSNPVVTTITKTGDPIATVGDFVWADLDADGVQDGGEPGLAGVTVRIYNDVNNNGVIDLGDTQVDSTTTDSNGIYHFYGLTAGNNYTVTYDLSGPVAGYVPTTDSDGDAGVTVHDVGTLSNGQVYATADFGLRPPGTSSIGDTVWVDLDQNGVVDGSEVGIPNIDVKLYADINNNGILDGPDVLVQTVSTDANGNYVFNNVAGTVSAPVMYLVDVDETDPQWPGGLTLVTGGSPITSPPTGGVWSVNINAAGTTVTTADFGYDYNGQIGDTVFYDDNMNTVQDLPTETGVPNVVVTLYNDLDQDGEVSIGDTIRDVTITDANGNYLFTELPPGYYVVYAEEQTVESRSTPGLFGTMLPTLSEEKGIQLVPATMTRLDADFGFVEAAVLDGHVFHDQNRDGFVDPTEPRLSPVTVELYGPGPDGILGTGDDVLLQTTTTDVNGFYEFIVSPGDYLVKYDTTDPDAQPGVLTDHTTPVQYQVTAANGVHLSDLDFGVDNTGSIGDTIFADLDSNGSQGVGEPGLPSVSVELYLDNNNDNVIDGGDTYLSTVATDSNGNYLFPGLLNGNYVVRVLTGTLPGGYGSTPTATPPTEWTSGSVAGATVAGGGATLDRDFGYPPNTPVFSVSGNIWDDNGAGGGTAADGIKNGTEPNIANVTVDISVDADGAGPNPPVVYTVVTDGSGNYSLSGIPAGSTVVITVATGTLPSSGYVQTGDPDGILDSTNSFTMPAANVTNKDFGYRELLGSISGTVAAGDGDGIYTPNVDYPLAGAQVTLRYAGDDGVLHTADDVISGPVTTTSTGAYSFTGLLPGLYEVTEVNPPGYASLADRDGGNPDVISVNLTVGQNVTGRDFEDTAGPSLGDRVWLDEDADGVQDAGESGIANVRLTLINAGLDQILGNGDDYVEGTTVTDSEGNYLFKDLVYGAKYRVVVDTATLPAGVATNQTGDPDVTFDSQTDVTMPATGEGIFTADFGYDWAPATDVTNNTNTGAIGDRVWVDTNGNGRQDPGEPGLGGVSVDLKGLGPDGIPGTGDDTTVATTTTNADGSYIFDGLPAGAYTVVVNGGVPPTGYVQSGDPDATLDNKTTTPIVLGPGDVYLNADFGYTPPPAQNNSVAGNVFNDINADGTYLAPDYGIPAVSVALIRDTNADGVWDPDGPDNTYGTPDDEPVVATTNTAPDGTYSFSGLPDGQYIVWVNDTGNVLTGLKITADPQGPLDGFAVVDLDSASTNPAAVDVTNQDFGYTPQAQSNGAGLIGDTVYLDRNGDGSQDLDGADNILGTADDEPGLEGVTVQLKDSTGVTVLATTTTDENGHYYFGGLSAATYKVQVDTSTLPGAPGDVPTNTGDPDGGGDSLSTVILGAGQINLAQDFGYRDTTAPNTISGTVWNDTNADGTLSGEAGRYAGVTVVLKDTDGNIVGTAITDANGNYSFPGLPDGTYVVDVTDTANVLNGLWKSNGTNPGADNNSQVDPYTVSVAGGVTDSTGDFGYYSTPSTLGDYVWFDGNHDGLQQGTEAGIPGVEVTLTIVWPDSSTTVLKTVTDASGFYSFSNLLLDESYTASTGTLLPSGTNPALIVSVNTGQGGSLSGLIPTLTDVSANSQDSIDSDDTTGVGAAVSKGSVNNTYDFGFIPFGPTAVELAFLKGHRYGDQVIIEWLTLWEIGTVGFDVERRVQDAWVRINGALIPALNSPTGGHYSAEEALPATGLSATYRLVETEEDGGLKYYGPFEVELRSLAGVAGFERVGGELRVQFEGEAGAGYVIEATSDLSLDKWETVGEGVAGPEGRLELGIDPGSGGATQRFFRAVHR